MPSALLAILRADLAANVLGRNKASTRHEGTLKLQLLQKKQVYYVADEDLIIQAVIAQGDIQTWQENPRPFNRFRTNYYNFNTKYVSVFKFNPQDCKGFEYPSPYSPEFHFQQRLQTYNPDNYEYDYSELTEVLCIHEWSVKIVNIANTGYYGCVLAIHKYDRSRERYCVGPARHLVLYDSQIAGCLEALRIHDMRREIGQPNIKNPISLCYYKKNAKAPHLNKNFISNFVTVDRTGKIVKTNLKQKQNYISLGNISGVLRFIRPLANFSEHKRTTINFSLFKSLPAPTNVQQQSQSESSSQSEPAEHDYHEDQPYEQAENYDDDDSDYEQQPLKLIYLKQLAKNMRI